MKAVRKRIKKAMEKAEKDVRKKALKPKKPKKRKVEKKDDTEQRSPAGKWIRDEWGNQGEVFFDGYRYSGVFFEPCGTLGWLLAVTRSWSPEKWEERKKPQPKVELKSDPTETREQLSSTPKTTQSTKHSKRVPKGRSSIKSGKGATRLKQRTWQWTSTSPNGKKTQ